MLKFFRQQMILQFDWLKIFYTLCFRINITGRKTLKNNYLLWELQLLVPHCVRRNQGGSLFCQWLYSALHWHLMPLVPQVNRIAMVLLWEPFNTWAWQQWNESFVSCLENLKDGIPLQIQSCEKSKYRNPTVEFTRRKKTLLLLLCIYACPSSAFHKWKSLMDSGLPSKRSLQQRCGWQWWVHRSPPEALRSHKP